MRLPVLAVVLLGVAVLIAALVWGSGVDVTDRTEDPSSPSAVEREHDARVDGRGRGRVRVRLDAAEFTAEDPDVPASSGLSEHREDEEDGAPRIGGTVRRADGRAVSRAEVRVGRGELAWGHDVGLVFTDATGSFTFPVDATTSYWVRASFRLGGRGVRVDISEEGVRSGDRLAFVEPALETIEGTLVDTEGRPLGGVKVEFISQALALPDGGRLRVRRVSAWTGLRRRKGHFEVTVPKGMQLMPRLDGRGTRTVEGAAPLRSGASNTVVAYQGIAIEGVCVDPGGTPVEGAVVHARAGDRDRTAYTSADGRFRIPALKPGSMHAVHVRAFDVMRSAEQRVEAGTVDVQLQLVRGRTVEGTLRNARGEPVTRATLILSGVHGGKPVRHEVSVHAGRFLELGVLGEALVASVSLDGETETVIGRLPEPGPDGRIELVLAF